jgi:NAD(P)-dependent dehydrogenase (short-subunit alcohol dehydrogenase family)
MTNIVIGASSGMGAAVARRLAPRGRLLLADQDLDGLGKVVAELDADVEVVGCDITADDDIDALAARVDRLDALVITAGVSAANNLPGRRILEVNLIGTARVLDAVDPLLHAGSAAVCFASAAGHYVSQMDALNDPLADGFLDTLSQNGVDLDDALLAYSLSKRGVMQLVRSLAPSWGARGARILSLSPGCIDTPMGKRELAKNPIMEDVVQGTPLGRWGSPDEIANVVAFLTSDEASFMTASDVLVDGGQVGGMPNPMAEPSTGNA